MRPFRIRRGALRLRREAASCLFALPFVLLLLGACTVTTNASNGDRTCAADPAVVCSSGTGYSCTGADTPDQDFSGLSCGLGTPSSHGVSYCCAQTTGTCNADSSVVCSSGGGYTCSGSDTPGQDFSGLVCGQGSDNGDGTTSYCCSSASSSCAQDGTVSCTGGAAGYACTGTDTPDQSDSSLVCSIATPASGEYLYCCFRYSSSSCSQDSSVQGCQAGSYGFSCTGSGTPDQADASLTCSSGTPDPNTGDMLYCCTY